MQNDFLDLKLGETKLQNPISCAVTVPAIFSELGHKNF